MLYPWHPGAGHSGSMVAGKHSCERHDQLALSLWSKGCDTAQTLAVGHAGVYA